MYIEIGNFFFVIVWLLALGMFGIMMRCPIFYTYPDYILYRPNGVSGMGAFNDADIPRASTIRVSTGSIIPSSQMRAVL